MGGLARVVFGFLSFGGFVILVAACGLVADPTLCWRKGWATRWLGVAEGVFVEAFCAEEGFEPEAEHVEAGEAGGDEAYEPEELA